MSLRTENENMGLDGFAWFFGVVEDRNDPLKAGRVRVRIYNWHTDDRVQIPTASLPWAQCMSPITSAAMGDIGHTPTGMVEGTMVFGFFLDGKNAQHPMVLGSVAGIPTQLGSVISAKGFSDPSGTYPARKGEPDVNRLARGDSAFTPDVITNKDTDRTLDVATARSGDAWSEPAASDPALSVYPKNHVYQTESGHIREYDDSPDNKRIHEYHAAGTFYEIDDVGNKITRVVGDNYTLIAGSDYIKISGDANITVDGTLRLKANRLFLETQEYTLNVGGESLVNYEGKHSITYGDELHTKIGDDTYTRKDAGKDYTCPTDPPRTTGTDCSEVDVP